MFETRSFVPSRLAAGSTAWSGDQVRSVRGGISSHQIKTTTFRIIGGINRIIIDPLEKEMRSAIATRKTIEPRIRMLRIGRSEKRTAKKHQQVKKTKQRIAQIFPVNCNPRRILEFIDWMDWQDRFPKYKACPPPASSLAPHRGKG